MKELTKRQGEILEYIIWYLRENSYPPTIREIREAFHLRSNRGVIDPYHRVFGHPGLHVIDGAAVGANLGANPSLTITAMAERAMSMWPNRGEEDPRPPLGEGYRPVEPVTPAHPAVPRGAPGAL